MTSVLDLVRPDLRAFAGYSSARREKASGHVWLNANESPWTSPADEGGRLNRYPEPQPAALRDRLATLYGVAPERAMVTRGSDEGIDLLVRAFCRAGIDGVLIAPPCFGMYAVDKSAAKSDRRRVSEGSLHMVALLGGWPGALIAQQFLRHKSTKTSFRQTFWGTVVINVVGFVFLCSPLAGKVLNSSA